LEIMKVARTITLRLGLVALGVMAGLMAVLTFAELSYLGEDMENDHRSIIAVLDSTIVDMWTNHDRSEATAMIGRLRRNGLLVALHGPEGLSDLTAEQRERLERTGFTSFEKDGYRGSWATVGVKEPTWVELRESISAHYQWVKGLLATGLISAVALLVMFLAIALVTGRRLIGEPVERLVAFAHRVGEGDFSARSDVTSDNELGELGRQLDSMAHALLVAREGVRLQEEQRHAAEERMHHAERLTTVGKLAAGIAHELGTPLSVVGTWGRMIASGEAENDEARKGGRIVADEAAAMTHIIRQLVDFARRRSPQRAEVDVNTLIETTVTLVGTLASQRNLTLVHHRSDRCVVSVDAVQVQQVLTNLVMNGMQSMKGGGTIELAVEREERPPPADVDPDRAARKWVVIHVRDHGMGIAPEIIHRVFEPFFTTKDVGEGSGLGLSVSWSMVSDHGGWIEARSELGAGSDFAVYLPG